MENSALGSEMLLSITRELRPRWSVMELSVMRQPTALFDNFHYYDGADAAVSPASCSAAFEPVIRFIRFPCRKGPTAAISAHRQPPPAAVSRSERYIATANAKGAEPFDAASTSARPFSNLVGKNRHTVFGYGLKTA